MRFLVGDTVRVKEHSEINNKVDISFVDDMVHFCGKEFLVDAYDGFYKLKTLDGENIIWYFHEEWLEFASNLTDMKDEEIMELFF